MDRNTATSGGTRAATAPLAENGHVKELLGILRDNGKDTAGLDAIINHVADMESFVKAAESKIADMKAQLDAMKEAQDHPIRNSLQKTIRALENKVAEIKRHLTELKSNIINGCKDAAASFKAKGAAALDKLVSFFKIKGSLQAVGKAIDDSVKLDDKAIGRIEAFSKEYHETGRHMANLRRVLTGKPLIDTAKESGKLAKAVGAPYRAHKTVQLKMKAAVTAMVGKLERLEQKAAESRDGQAAGKAGDAAEKKPTLAIKLKINKELIRRIDQEKQAPGLAKKQGIEV